MSDNANLMQQVYGMDSNKTTEFFLPYLVKEFPFLTTIKPHLSEVKCGIADGKDTIDIPSIYILVKFTKFKKGQFKKLIEKIRGELVKEYLYGDYLHDFYHMFVVKVDESIYRNFINCQYSKMYQDPSVYFTTDNSKYKKRRENILKILTKNKDYQHKLEKTLKLKDGQLDGLELCSNLKLEEEIFNYKQWKLNSKNYLRMQYSQAIKELETQD